MAVGAPARHLRHRLRRLRRARLRRVAGGAMTRALGLVTAALLAVTAVMALAVSPPDAAVLLALYVGYLALRRVPADPDTRARRSAIAALLAFVDVPIVHQSVVWWRTLHQQASVLEENRLLHPTIHGSMLWTLLVGLTAFTLLYSWLLVHRFRLARVEDEAEDRRLELALAERRAEADVVPA